MDEGLQLPLRLFILNSTTQQLQAFCKSSKKYCDKIKNGIFIKAERRESQRLGGVYLNGSSLDSHVTVCVQRIRNAVDLFEIEENTGWEEQRTNG